MEERVLALRTDSLKLEKVSRNADDKLRLYWADLYSVAAKVFDRTIGVLQSMIEAMMNEGTAMEVEFFDDDAGSPDL